MKKEYLLFLSKGETISGPLNLFSIVTFIQFIPKESDNYIKIFK